MRLSPIAFAAGSVLLLASGTSLAHPGGGGGMHTGGMASMPMTSPVGGPAATHSSQGSTNGQGWHHENGPTHTGQPSASCGSASAPNTPGNAAAAPGSAFNPDGKAGSVYAGEQAQNSRNTASVSQYDAACAHQPQG